MSIVTGTELVHAAPPAPQRAELPREYVTTEIGEQTGRTVVVPAGGDLQSAINSARLGDTIALAAGATYRGNFVLPRKEGTGWLTLRTATADERLGQGRVAPSQASLMPRLVAASGAVIGLAPGAHHYRFVGLEISPAPAGFSYGLVAETEEIRTEAQLPHHVIFDRCYIHGDPAKGSRRGVVLNGKYMAVVRSYVADFKEAGADSQALAGWNGSGPFKIVDNFLEGGAENIMFGGADPAIPGLVPADIEIRGNTISKNTRWYSRDPAYDGSRWTLKTLFELKNARRVLIEGNLLEQFQGYAFVLTPRNQGGRAPWSTVEDVTIRHNWVRHVWAFLNVSGFDEYHPSQPTRRITVEHNIAEGLYDRGESNPKTIIVGHGPNDVTISHNTLLTNKALGSSFLCFADAGKKGNAFAFTDNIATLGAYGLIAENPGLGANGINLLDGHFTSWSFTGNVLVNTAEASTNSYPKGQRWVSSLQQVGFRNVERRDYALKPTNRGRGSAQGAAEASDPGADQEAIRATFRKYMSVPGPFDPPR